MEEQFEYGFDSGTDDQTFSLWRKTYMIINGSKIYTKPIHRLGVTPNDIDKVASFAPKLVKSFEAIWTDEVKEAWNAKIEAMKQPVEEENQAVEAQ